MNIRYFLATILLCVCLLTGTAAAGGQATLSNVLLIASDTPGSTLKNELLTLGVPVVVALSSSGPPALSTMEQYDVVVTWTNSGPSNPVGWRDVLADYVDGGGAVVIGTFAWSPGFDFEGGINDPGYSPFHVGAGFQT